MKLLFSGKWVDRFFSKVNKTDTCWLWSAYTRDGYGRTDGIVRRETGGEYTAHRISWVLHNGVIPDGLQVLHKCDVRHCVNPRHLYLGTNRDNVTDRNTRGRTAHNKGEKHGRSKLTWEQVRAIRKEFAAGANNKDLSKKYGVAKSQIYFIVNFTNWKEDLCQ